MGGHQSTPDQDDPPQVVDRFVEAWNRHDMKALGDLFRSDADFVDVFGNWFKGRSAFEEALTQRHRTVFRASRFTTKEVVVRRVGSELAVVNAVIELTGATDPGGNLLPPGLGVMSFVLEPNTVHGWRIVTFQNTAVAPPHTR